MATFGNQNTEANPYGAGANEKHASKFTLTEPGYVTTMFVYLDGLGPGGGNQVHRAIIYDDDGASGDPGTLLGVSAELTLIDDSAGSWREFTFTTPVALAAGDYYLGFHSGLTSQTSRYWRGDTAALQKLNIGDTYSDGTNATWGSVSNDLGPLSVYATYTTVVAVGRSLVLPYVMNGCAGRSLALPSTVRSFVARSLVAPYIIRVNVGQSISTPYVMHGAVGKSLALAYLAQAHVGRSLVLVYSIGQEGMAFPHKHAGDAFDDGASVAFGFSFPDPRVLSIFGTYVLPWVPEQVPALHTARLGFQTAQARLGRLGQVGERRVVALGWHGTSVDDERGSVAIVRPGSELADDLVGTFVRVSPLADRRRSVIAFVHASSDELDEDVDMSLSRRTFMAVGLLSEDLLDGVIEVVG